MLRSQWDGEMTINSVNFILDFISDLLMIHNARTYSTHAARFHNIMTLNNDDVNVCLSLMEATIKLEEGYFYGQFCVCAVMYVCILLKDGCQRYLSH